MKTRDDVILIANRRAGFSFRKWSAVDKWAFRQRIREYILPDIEELGLVIANLDPAVRLVLIYGGDGTVFYVLNFLEKNGRLKLAADPEESVLIVPIGGGTMRRLSRFTRWVDEPVENAKKALKLYDQYYHACLLLPLLSVKWGEQNYVGCTCLTGAIVKVMKEYSRFKTTPVLAGLFSLAALGAGLTNWPPYLTRLYGQFEGLVTVDGRPLADRRFLGTLADTLDTAIFHMVPYLSKRGPGDFHCLAYAVGHEELVRNFLRLAIGRPPPLPRYFNQSVKELTVEPVESLDITFDGEFFTVPAQTKLTITLGPRARILVNPTLSIPLVSQFFSTMESFLEMRELFWPGLKK